MFSIKGCFSGLLTFFHACSGAILMKRVVGPQSLLIYLQAIYWNRKLPPYVNEIGLSCSNALLTALMAYQWNQ